MNILTCRKHEKTLVWINIIMNMVVVSVFMGLILGPSALGIAVLPTIIILLSNHQAVRDFVAGRLILNYLALETEIQLKGANYKIKHIGEYLTILQTNDQTKILLRNSELYEN